MALPASISHLAHLEHKLWLQDTGKSFMCDSCRERGRGDRYRCHACDFDFHKQCALDERTNSMALPALISHPAHLGHKLSLEATEYWVFVCNGCRESGAGERYRCRACKFDLHKQCALEEGTKIMAYLGSISHPTHWGHRLSLEATDYWKFVCNGCGKHGMGERYRCRACKFDLHKQCALGEGAKIMGSSGFISHPTHWEHMLTLYASDSWKFMCNGCREGGAGESYRCHACDFDLHKQCALGERTKIMDLSGSISHPAHWGHKLSLQDTGYNFQCDGCRECGVGQRYRCHACDFDLHKQCALDEGTKLVHPLLKNIELELRFQAPAGPKDGSRLVCDACSNAVLGFHYHSSKLYLHPCCAVVSTRDEKKEKVKEDGCGGNRRSRSNLDRILSVSGHISDAIDTGDAIADLFFN